MLLLKHRARPQEGDGMNEPHGMRAASRYSLLVLAGIVLASCGGDPARDEPRDQSAATADTPPPETDRATEALPAGGPVDVIVPPGDPAYQFLAAGNCGELKGDVEGWGPDVVEQESADTVELYRSAAAVCLGEWDQAIAAFGRIGSPPDLEGVCAREAVYGWLRPLIQDRQADPQFDPEFVPSQQSNPCPTDSPTDEPTDDETGGEGEPTGDDPTDGEPTDGETTDEGTS